MFSISLMVLINHPTLVEPPESHDMYIERKREMCVYTHICLYRYEKEYS